MIERRGLSAAMSLTVAILSATGAVLLSLTEAHATAPAAPIIGVAVSPTAPAATPSPLPSPTPAPKPAPSTTQLASDIQGLADAAGATVGVSLVQLGPGAGPATWSLNGSTSFTAASTYKLPLLMAEAEGIANGSLSPDDVLCYDAGDWEDGWFFDYVDGSCYRRAELAQRVGQYSDNTAAHILVRYLGGTSALDSYGAARGAVDSQFYDPNTTTADDLARLWQSEAGNGAGGPAAQGWLYPLLTQTRYEQGIPAGSPGATVVHKVGFIDSYVNDAALVLNGPNGPYILTICTDGAGGDDGFRLVALIAARVAQYEAQR